ncbi:MAG: TolC family protein [Aquificaceae bacterium]
MAIMLLLLLFVSLAFSIELKDAIRLSLENSPYVKGLYAERLLYQAKSLSYRAGLNPSLSFEVGNFGTNKESFPKSPLYGITYTQPFLPPSLFRLTGEAYQLHNRYLDYKVKMEGNKIAHEVYLLFYQALYYKELLKVLEEELKLQRDLKAFIEKSYSLGEIPKLDVFRWQRETELLQGEKEIIYAKYRSLLSELSVLVGKKVEDVEGDLKAPVWHEFDLDKSPFMEYYRGMEEVINKFLQVERNLAKPLYTFSLTAEKVADREYGVRMGISVSLPVFYGRQAEILDLTAQRQSLVAERENQKLRAIAQIDSAKSQYTALLREVERIERELLPQADQELALAIKSYKLRAIGILELSQTKKAYYELLKRRLELLLQAHNEYAKGIVYGGALWCGCY